MHKQIHLSELQKRIVQLTSIIAILFVSICMRLNYINQREGMHIDEVMSIMISRYSPQWHAPLIDSSGRDIKEHCFWNDASLAQALSDVKKLYLDNRDRPHTNLYYSLLRLSFVGVSSFDLKRTIWRGGLLNIILFIFSFLFLFKLLQLLVKDDLLLQSVCLLFAFCNIGSISNSLLLRTYQLQETCLIVFTYCIINILYKGIANNRLFWLCITSAFTLLSGYFATIYVLIGYSILVWFNRKTYAKNIIFAFVFSLLISQLLYAKFFCGFTCGRAGEGYKALFSFDVFNNIFTAGCDVYKMLKNYLFNYHVVTVAFFAAIIIVPCLAFHRIICVDKNISIVIGIVIANVIWISGNMFLAYWKELRYISASFPLISLISIVFVNAFRHIKTLKYCACACVLAVTFCKTQTSMPYLYKDLATLKTILKLNRNKHVYRIGDDCLVLFNLIQCCDDEQNYHTTYQIDNIAKLSNILIFSDKKYSDMKELWHSDNKGCYLYEK